MAKVHLDRLKERFGADLSRQELMTQILAENTKSISNAVGRINVQHFKEQAAKFGDNAKRMTIPPLEDVLPKRSVYFRQAAKQGQLLTDGLRTKLANDLRQTVADFLDEGETAMQGRGGGQKGRISPKLVNRLKDRISQTFEGYTRRSPLTGIPPNVEAIAVTETRSAINTIKNAYADRLAAKNPDLEVGKRWIHNPKLSKVPRPGHQAINGVVVPLDQKFEVPVFVANGRYVRGVNRGRPKWKRTSGVVLMDHPHDPDAPASEVISCNCDFDIVVRKRPNTTS